MSLSKLDKTSHMVPLLVRLYDAHKLYRSVESGQSLERSALTCAVADLFEAELSEKEQELLADVLIGLMKQAEKDLRKALAERLAVLDHVPLRLILHLTNDDIVIAAPILQKSMVLSDLDLMYIIKSQGADYWQAIAAREHLSNELIDVLAETRDIDTAVILSKNERVTLTRYALDVLSEMAKKDEDIARPLLMRLEMPGDLASSLYGYVGRELKDYIKAFFGGHDPDVEAVVDDLVLEFADAPALLPSKFMPSGAMIEDARKERALNLINMDGMMETLDKGEIPSFIASFSVYTGILPKKVHDFLKQSCPKGMAIACRAFGVQKNDFVKIYLMTHRMRSRHRMINQKDMIKILKYFDKIRPEAAIRIVKRATSGVQATL